MKPVLTADEYRRVDQAYTGDLDRAMDRAGFGVALAVAGRGIGYGSRVVVLAGPGNNGGDGYVAARYLSRRGAQVEVHSLGEPRTPTAIKAASLASARGVSVTPLGSVVEADLVIDALFGGGVRGGLPREVAAWIETRAPVVAVDYPTGLDPNTGQVEEGAFHSVATVTFQTLKTGHVIGVGPDHCGEVHVVDIGIEGGEPSMWVAQMTDAPRPRRSRTAHKWSAGSVLVVGGSSGMTGAAVFAGRAALGFGAGSVAVATSRPDLVATLAPELLTFGLDEAQDRLDRFEVVIAGPGLSEIDLDKAMSIVAKASNVLLDAGALLPRVVDAAVEGTANIVVTPHAREFERIAGTEAGALAAGAYSKKTGATVLLKGNPTLVSDGSAPVLVRTGGPELASIGTGDVLSGVIGALWARGLDPHTAAVSGSYWHGVAGADLARSRTVTADRLASHVARYAG